MVDESPSGAVASAAAAAAAASSSRGSGQPKKTKERAPVVLSFDAKPILDVSVAEWERYLESSPCSGGVRLKLAKVSALASGAIKAGMTWSQALDVALCFGWIDGQAKRLDEHFMLTSFTPRRKNSVWSQVNREHVARLSEQKRMRPGGLAEVERAKADGRWDAAYRQKGATAPEDLQAALDAVPAAAAYFASLTRVQRFRTYFRLNALKKPQTRAARIRDIVAQAAKGEQFYQ
jgi:uncharacterized protein YdeI (YjbR/CyaY-like superfamily)